MFFPFVLPRRKRREARLASLVSAAEAAKRKKGEKGNGQRDRRRGYICPFGEGKKKGERGGSDTAPPVGHTELDRFREREGEAVRADGRELSVRRGEKEGERRGGEDGRDASDSSRLALPCFEEKKEGGEEENLSFRSSLLQLALSFSYVLSPQESGGGKRKHLRVLNIAG